MIKLKCSICGRVKSFKNMEEAMDDGWSIVDTKVDGRHFRIVACPDHSGDEVFELIREKIVVSFDE